MFVIVWKYSVRAGAVDEFRAAYGPSGDWARLFHRSPAFMGVELIAARPSRMYVTIDRWESQAAFDLFIESVRDEYEALDRRFAVLTEEEALVVRGHPVDERDTG